MKILICTGIYPPDIGGPATYTKLISKELKERGHEVSVLTYGDERITNYELRITSIGRKYFLPVRYFFYFLKVLQLGKNADVIYVQDPVSVGLPTALANLILEEKMILKVVGDYAWEQAMQVQNTEFRMQNLDDFYPFKKELYPLKIRLMQKIQVWVAGRAHKIITPSFYLKKILTQGWRMPEEKIKVIYNSFDINQQPTANSQQPDKNFKILSVGRLVPWKGFDMLIEAAKENPRAELDIAGDGPEYKNYELRITNYELQDKIRLSGKLSHDKIIKKMAEVDLFILNSSYEGLSHVILEAMAVGLPVAVSRAGGNTELAGENEERGYLFEYNNKEQIKQKIEYIISHHEEAAEKAKKAREFVADFSKDKMIERLEKELEHI
jgi:glycosyltransferase involved in cell wall biosynthesis